VEALPFVRWVGAYEPAYRLAPDLLATVGKGADASAAASVGDGLEARTLPAEEGPLSLTVLVFPDEDIQSWAEALRGLGGTVHEVAHSKWKGTIRVDLPTERLIEAARMPGVKWIEPAPGWEWANNVAADIMNVRAVWDTHGLRGEGQVVAVADSGLDQGSTDPAALHDDFEDGGGSRVVALFDLVGDGAGDVNSGHGTHVAGSVVGNGLRSGSDPTSHSYPDTGYAGIAPEADLVFQAVEENNTGALAGIPADLNDLLGQAYDAGARVHSNSWGAAVDGAYTSDSQSVDEFVWDHPDMVVVFAAGNHGEDADGSGKVDGTSLDAPGTAKNAITVGATESLRPPGSSPTPGYDMVWGTGSWAKRYPVNPLASDHVSNDPNGVAAFSSRGPTLDGRTKPDLVAPGTNIVSVRSSMASGILWGAVSEDYVWSGGTSMATPLAAGAAALVREYYTRTQGVEPSAALVKATLANGAQGLFPGQYGSPVPYWHRETVGTAHSSDYTSLALDGADHPHISYYSGNLEYAWHDGTTWLTDTVDSAPYTGWYSSLALDSSDRPHISYFYDMHGNDLKYARYDGSSWHIETVDSHGSVGLRSSLALDSSDHPHISYYHGTSEDLKYAWHDGSTWHRETVDSDGKAGYDSSLALDASGHPHIVYGADYDLRYAWHDGSTWHIETATSTGSSYSHVSLALDSSDHPYITYYDATRGDLMVARRNGASWFTDTVDSDGGDRPVLALDARDRPHIAYYSSNGTLKHARYDGSYWQTEKVDLPVKSYSISLALDTSGKPHVSYHKSDYKLRHTYWETGPSVGPVEVTPRPNPVEGWGRVDLGRTLFPSEPLTTTFVDQSQGLQTGETDTYPFTVSHYDHSLRATLAWSDYPGSPAAAGGLVNDLDLVVIAPGGSALHPTNASERGASENLMYDDSSYSSTVYRWDRSNRGMAVRFTPTAYPAVVDSVQFFLIVSGVPCPYFEVRVLDDDGYSGSPGTVILEKPAFPVSDGWFTLDLEGLTIGDGNFHVELHYVGGWYENPFLALDSTSPTGRSYVYDGSSWCALPCAGAPSGNWGIRALAHTPGEETEADRVNNVVGVDVPRASLGTYTVEVRGHNVPQGPQPYALVISTRDCLPLMDVNTAGPVTATAGATAAFTATAAPPTATLPVTYTWDATGQTPLVQTGGVSDTAAFTWDVAGTHAITVTAVNACGGTVTDTRLITVEMPCFSLEDVALTGPVSGTVGVAAVFAATAAPPTTTLPVTYTWEAAGQTSLVQTGGLSDTAAFTWDVAGTHAITVTAVNACGGTVTDTRLITVEMPCFSLEDVALTGPVSGTAGVATVFTATVAPPTTTPPVTYTWEATGQTPLVQTGGVSDTAAFTWDVAGTHATTVTAVNACGDTVTDTHLITVEVPCFGLEDVTITGRVSGTVGAATVFTATVAPPTTTLPVTYTWEATGQTPLGETGGLSDTAALTWDVAGSHAVTVTAENCDGRDVAMHTIAIEPGVQYTYLPLILRGQ
jgi:subtilisin family serine protease